MLPFLIFCCRTMIKIFNMTISMLYIRHGSLLCACKCAELNLLIDLYKEVMEETVNPEVAKDASGAQNSSVDIMDEDKPSEQQNDMKPPPESGASVKPEGNSSEKQEAEDDAVQGTGTYVVGGSAFGWNFITYTSGKAIYYGRTKESFRSSYVKSE